MIANIDRLFQKKELIWTWTGRIIWTRYQQSMLGALWMIVQPVATVAIFTIVFTYFVPVNTGDVPYVVFSYVALVPWTLLANSLPDLGNSIVENMQLVKKIYFPREILPLSAMLARLLDFFLAAGIFVVLILVYRIPLFPVGWLFLPVILLVQLALICGLGLGFAAANVFYRDMQPLLTLVIRFWFYASPIIYPVSLVPDRLRPFYYLNPMAGILEAYRAVLLHQNIPGPSLYVSAIMALVILVSGYWFFKRVEYQFADIV
jgi:lipopolysaccharide transport system permease protein